MEIWDVRGKAEEVVELARRVVEAYTILEDEKGEVLRQTHEVYLSKRKIFSEMERVLFRRIRQLRAVLPE